jgi:glucan phosphorylase
MITDIDGPVRVVFVQNYNCSYAERIISRGGYL